MFIERIYNRLVKDNLYRRIRKIKHTRKWFRSKGLKNPHPPPFIKQKIVKAYAKRFSIDTLIETGTFHGEMALSNRKTFKKIYSIELDEALHEIAKNNCVKYPHILLFHGDSAKILPKILSNIKQPCLFWLDAHYSGEGTAKGNIDTPIKQELQHILNNFNINHVILIDDAEFFVGKDGYPTIKEVKEIILNKTPDRTILVRDNIIRIYKKIKSSEKN